MKIWDLRKSYKSLYEYHNQNSATCETNSQKGLFNLLMAIIYTDRNQLI